MSGALLALGLLTPTLAAAAPAALPPADQQAFWTPAEKLVGFRSMARLYGGDVVHHGTRVMPLPKADTQREVHFAAGGRAFDVASFMEHNRVAGLIVLHHGRIVLERYGLGQSEHDQWVSFSVAKSVTSTLLGAAIRDGSIGGLDDPVSRYIPELAASGYAGVSLRQALMMSAGLRWNEDYADPQSDWGRTLSLATPGDTRPGVDIVAYMAHLPRVSAPGTAFLYNSGNAQILGVVVQRAVHKTLAAYLEASGDRALLDVAPPFFAFRALVLAHPRWYPHLTDSTRRALLAFATAMMAPGRFDPETLPVVFGGGRMLKAPNGGTRA